MSSYNTIPYESLPVSYTYLPHLAALGRLYGLETVSPDNCRVLEIGCAEGNNIIPMAWYYPRSQFVGIDLSGRQIRTGQKMIERLALNNIELHTQDIAQLNTEKQDRFDYILLHGVFSWVTPELQQTILEKTHALLSDQGMIYISYNTYPGWHAQMVLRDALLLHCSDTGNSPDPNKEIRRIPAAIQYFKDFFNTADNELSTYYTRRLAALERHPEKYLYHEFLETNNHPLYLSDFVKLADRNGLQYLTDALQAFDNTVLLGEQRNAFLDKFDHRIKRLQYMDFMINQRFRRSLLCHKHQSIRQSFSPEHMTGIAYRAKLYSKRKPAFNSDRTCQFYQGKDPGTFIKLSHPVTKAAVHILSHAYPASIHYMDLLQQSCQHVANHKGMPFLDHIQPFYQEFYFLVNNDWISLDTTASSRTDIDWEKPVFISRLSFEYAKTQGFIPTPLQQAIDIDKLSMTALELIYHGTHRQELIDKTIFLLSHNNNTKRKYLFFNQHHKKNNIKKRVDILLSVLENNNLIEQKC